MSDDSPDLSAVLRTAQQVQQQLTQVQEELARKTVEGAAGGGMVVVTANGRHRLLGMKIDPEIIDREDVTMMEDLIVAAANQALAKADEMAQQEMSKITGGVLKVPGLF